MSGYYRLFFLLAISTTILCHYAHAGPARSLALAAARASTRSIRAPFRQSEISIARGYGKRSQASKIKEAGEIPWKFIDEYGVDGDSLEQNFYEQSVESFPIDWLANEMASNPMLAYTILHRLDANKDGVLSSHELLAGVGQPSSDSNDGYSRIQYIVD